jgi:hypothetical protein
MEIFTIFKWPDIFILNAVRYKVSETGHGGVGRRQRLGKRGV